MLSKVVVKEHPRVEIGRAVFAQVDIDKNELVIESRVAEVLKGRNMFSIERDGTHVLITEPGVLVNHSCAPNCAISPNEHGAFNFVALRKINKDEEITFDYESNESEITAFSECLCGSEACREQMNMAQ